MIPYFSTITTPLQVIVWIFLMLLCITVSMILPTMTPNDQKWQKYILTGTITALFFISLSWLYIGDSFEWSKPIGLWLRGK